MLQALSDGIKNSKLFAYLVVGLITAAFALFGLGTYLSGAAEVSVASVNGEDISQYAYQEAYSRQRQQLAQTFGGRLPAGLFDDETLAERALESLITEEVLSQSAAQAGYRISDEELSSQLRARPEFQTDGEFDREQYQLQVESLGLSTAGFEEIIRHEEKLAQRQAAIFNSALNLSYERKLMQRLHAQQRDIAVLRFSAEDDAITPNEQEIKAYYEEHQEELKFPERVRIDFLLLDQSALRDNVTVSEQELQNRYAELVEQKQSEQERRASHILLQVPSDENAEDFEAVTATAKRLLDQLRDGADFAELAKEHSTDPGSAAGGGDLGWVTRGSMVRPFEDALYSMELGTVSEPVRTRFGLHLIKLHEVRGDTIEPFEELRDQLAETARANAVESQYLALIDELQNLTYEAPESLLPAAEALDLNVSTSDWFSNLDGEGIAVHALVRDAAFSEEVAAGNNSDLIELNDGSVVVLRVNERAEARNKSLQEADDEIIDILKVTQLREHLTAMVSKAEQALAGGTSAGEFAKQNDAQWEEYGYIDRRASEPEQRIVQAAFAMGKPAPGEVAYDSMELDANTQVLIVLRGVQAGDNENGDDATATSAGVSPMREYEAVVEGLVNKASIERRLDQVL